jgi:propionyl-CoA carboxylase alpha chain
LPAQPPTSGGWAIEARLYAEDPTRGSQPQSGTFTRLGVPHDTTFEASELRLDSGVENGSVVPVDYDSLLAKVIAWAPTRSRATHRLAAALRMARLHGPITNRDQLVRVLEHPDFAAGRVDTGWLDRQDLSTPLADELTVRLSAVAAALARVTDQHRRTGILPGVPPGWRNVPSAPRRTGFVEADLNFEVTGRRVSVFDDRLIIAEVNAERVVLEHGGVRVCFEMGHSDGHVHVDSPLGAVRLTPLDRFPQARDEQYYPGSLMAPLPGTVSRVAVTVGEPVAAGQPLLWLEAMKMEHRIDAPTSGVVSQLPVPAGAPVKAGDVLVVLTAGTDDA